MTTSVKLYLYGRFCSEWRTTSIFWQMEDDLNILASGRRPQCFGKWKMTSIFWKMEVDLNILANEIGKGKTTILVRAST